MTITTMGAPSPDEPLDAVIARLEAAMAKDAGVGTKAAAHWNADVQRVIEALPSAVNDEREAIISALPGGQICDPQSIADMIRARASANEAVAMRVAIQIINKTVVGVRTDGPATVYLVDEDAPNDRVFKFEPGIVHAVGGVDDLIAGSEIGHAGEALIVEDGKIRVREGDHVPFRKSDLDQTIAVAEALCLLEKQGGMSRWRLSWPAPAIAFWCFTGSAALLTVAFVIRLGLALGWWA